MININHVNTNSPIYRHSTSAENKEKPSPILSKLLSSSSSNENVEQGKETIKTERSVCDRVARVSGAIVASLLIGVVGLSALFMHSLLCVSTLTVSPLLADEDPLLEEVWQRQITIATGTISAMYKTMEWGITS